MEFTVVRKTVGYGTINLSYEREDPMTQTRIRSYNIEEIKQKLTQFSNTGAFCVVDENVYKLYGHLFDGMSLYVLPSGERSKSMHHYTHVLEALMTCGCKRSDTLIAVGGGVVGDLAAFCASTYKRGMKLIHVPTTLLAMVDSSIGGKTAINFGVGKNNVGTFYEACEIWQCETFLESLPQREWTCGMAEVMKYALGFDEAIWTLLKEKPLQPHQFSTIIKACVHIKQKLVAEDPYDFGERQKLNFGHTIGHALESVYAYERYNHGEAVAIGLTTQVALSKQRGAISGELYNDVKALMTAYGLWQPLPKSLSLETLVAHMQGDKKNESEAIVWFEWLGFGQLVKKQWLAVEIMNPLRQVQNED